MSNKVTFEAAVSTLESMFPDWDRQDLENMLVSNRNHVENTIDAIFQVGAPPRPRGSSAGRATPAASATPPSRSSPATKTHSPYGEPYRGRTVQLPDDFLRPPAGFVANNLGFDDEQLSMLLQNEMFQREVALTLGRQNPLVPPPPPPAAGATGRGGVSRASSAAAGPTPAAGDIKSRLASMGAAAKRNLNNLALSFSRRARSAPGAAAAPTEERETSALMNYFEDKPDEGDEVITFEQRNVAAPALPRGAPRHALEDPVAPGSAMFRKSS